MLSKIINKIIVFFLLFSQFTLHKSKKKSEKWTKIMSQLVFDRILLGKIYLCFFKLSKNVQNVHSILLQ
jgi:hypothetical protein